MISKNKRYLVIGIVIVLCVAVGVGAVLLLNSRKPDKDAEQQSTVAITEAVTGETSETETAEIETWDEEENAETVYIVFDKESNIPKGVAKEDIVVTDDGYYNVPYESLVEAAKSAKNTELTFRDKDENRITVSGLDYIESNTEKVSTRTMYSKSKEITKELSNTSIKTFRKVTKAKARSDLYEKVTETVTVDHGTMESTSVVYHQHDYKGFVSKKATCEEEGVYTFLCEECGDSYDEPIKSTGHRFKGKVTKDPTCTEEGTIAYTCKDCGKRKYESVAKTDHYYTGEITKRATCQDTGIKTYTCAYCGDTYTEPVKKVGHEWQPMRTYTLSCSDCGKTFVSRGRIEEAALAWEEHINNNHPGNEDVSAIPSVEEGEGEICIYCGKTR